MNNEEKQLNSFFVEVFNLILNKEEIYIAETLYKDVSIKEVHVLEAISLLEAEEKNTMTNIAHKINISVGALTTSIKPLIRKGYVERVSSEKDHRIVNIYLTDKGKQVCNLHEQFHQKMIDYIYKTHNNEELRQFTNSLTHIKDFFSKN